MKLLALDAATPALSVAVLDTDRDFAREHFEIAPRAHAARLLPVAVDLLDRAGWSLAALDGLAFGRGPGAFTGLRIAAGLIQGLATGLATPVVPVSTLAAIAARCFAYSGAQRAVIVNDARMGEIYTAEYRRGDGAPALVGDERVIQPAALRYPDLASTVLGGNGWHLVVSDTAAIDVAVEWPHAADIAWLAAIELAAGRGQPAAAALPVYVRDEVVRGPRR